jgi:hypothetical protein
VHLADKLEEARAFHAYINASGALINEGIVATQQFVENLARSEAARKLFRAAEGRRRYVALSFDEGSGQITIGLRKLGAARLKGLGSLAIYEVVDCENWTGQEFEPLGGANLLQEIEKDYDLAARTGARRA